MSVWFCIPSARPLEQVKPVVDAWHARGYKVALWRDDGDWYHNKGLADFVHWGAATYPGWGQARYPGYAQAVNKLVKWVMEVDPSADWFVTGGDDTFPDPNHTAEEIAASCEVYFGTLSWPPDRLGPITNRTFGVMQPTGDRYAQGSIDRIAGSPWMGRGWCLRANQGKGPLWPEFTHMHVDECLKRTAEKLGVYWPRPDLMHFHQHFLRESHAIDARAVSKPVPPHLVKWNTPSHWEESKAIFKRLEAEDFAPCMPLVEVPA